MLKLPSSFYYNPQDPSIFVEKIVGVGWTVNFARPGGIIIPIIPILVFFIIRKIGNYKIML